MSVPKTAMDDDGTMMLSQHNIRTAGQFTGVESKPEARGMKSLSDKAFRFCIR